MKQRGRPSAGSLSVVPVFERPRPKPPEQLPEEGKEVWRGIVAGFRSDWFQGAEHLLKCYCEQVDCPAALGICRHSQARGRPFTGCFGLYAGMRPRDRVLVLLRMLGGEREVTLPKGDVAIV